MDSAPKLEISNCEIPGPSFNISDQRASMKRYTSMLDYVILYYSVLGIHPKLLGRFWSDWVILHGTMLRKVKICDFPVGF